MIRSFLYLLLLLLLTACSEDKIAEWHMVNVNYSSLQGDAHVLLAENSAFMIDAGYAQQAKERLVPFLKKHNIRRIKRAFVSHPHRDHYEGFAVILDSGIKIDNIYYNIPSPEISDCCYRKSHFQKHINHWKKSGVATHQVSEGDHFKLGKSTLSVIHAQKGNLPTQNIDVNDLSLIMKWAVGRHTVLFAGDLNLQVGKWLVDNKRSQLTSDILKVPHHGGYGIAPDSFFQAVNPNLMMVPGPEWVWCGKRGAQARKFSQINKIKTWVNGIHGTVSAIFSQNEVRISNDNDGSLSCGKPPLKSREMGTTETQRIQIQKM